MAKHRAQRNHFLVGCTLSLIAIFGFLSLFVLHSQNTSKISANVVNSDTPYAAYIIPKNSPVPTSPDTPPKPAAAELRAADQARAAAELKVQQDAAAQATAAKAAAGKAAAGKAAAGKAAAGKAAAPKVAAAKPTPPPAPPPAPTPAPSPSRAMNSSAYKAYAAGKVDATQFSCLDQMWTRESSWNPNAQNPGSTAYGIPQFLDSTWAGTGYAKTSDPYTQIDAGIAYVNKAYGGACSAWSFWQAHNYY